MPTILQEVLHVASISGIAHNGGTGGEFLLCGTQPQWERFADKMIESAMLRDAKWLAMFKRRAYVEQLMLDVANGKRDLPTKEELRAWALHLGTPNSQEPK